MIVNGTGRFANVSGQFTDHGVYGEAIAKSYGTLGAILELRGTMCGVELR
jgi:hypothetical protein